MVTVKICGITRLEDAERCLALDVEWLGLNFWPGSKRRCGLSEARRIVDAVGERARVVGVFVDASVEAMRNVLAETGVGLAQLHGEESVETLNAMLPHAFKALRATGPAVLELARPDIERALEHYAFDPHHPVELTLPRFGADSALLGAAELAFSEVLEDPYLAATVP